MIETILFVCFAVTVIEAGIAFLIDWHSAKRIGDENRLLHIGNANA